MLQLLRNEMETALGFGCTRRGTSTQASSMRAADEGPMPSRNAFHWLTRAGREPTLSGSRSASVAIVGRHDSGNGLHLARPVTRWFSNPRSPDGARGNNGASSPRSEIRPRTIEQHPDGSAGAWWLRL